MSTQEAVRHVGGEVRELITRSGLDPAHQSLEVRRLVQDAVADYDERSLHGGMPSLGDPRSAVHSIPAVVAGYGPLQQYFDDPTVEEICINEPSKIIWKYLKWPTTEPPVMATRQGERAHVPGPQTPSNHTNSKKR